MVGVFMHNLSGCSAKTSKAAPCESVKNVEVEAFQERFIIR